MTPTQQSNFCCQLQDATMTILHRMMISSANTPKSSIASMPRRPHLSTRAIMSLQPQWDRTTYAVQGNDKPLAIESDWTTIFDDRKRCQSTRSKIDCTDCNPSSSEKSATAPGMKLVSLRLPSQQMRQSKIFMSSSQEATSTRLRHTATNFVDCRSNNCTSPS